MDRRLRSALVVALLVGTALWLRHQRDRDRDDAAPARPATAQAAPGAPVAPPRPTRHYGAIAFQPCTLSAPLGADSADAQCGTFEVPEDRARPNGRRIALAVAWLPATGEALPDPVFMLAGGPGQGARESYPQISSAFAEVRKTRHVILVDQRGTGGSNPLACKDASGENAFWEQGEDASAAQGRAFAVRCANALRPKANVRFYTTGEAIDDLDAVRAALGAPQVNLVGISYGTRVAQQYARRYPKRTRTVVLDSVVPNTLVLGAEHARNLEASLALQFERCRRQPTCVALGDPRAQLDALLARVEAEPPMVRYRDGITGEARVEKLTRGHIAALVRLFAYAPQVAGLLPLELKEASEGRYESLMALSRLITSSLGDSIMHGMQLAVMCAEDADEMGVDPKDAKTLLGNDLISVLKAQCEVWPRGKRDPAFRSPLTGDVPVLILSGEFDPVTPPRYGEEVAKSLPRGRHLVVRGQGHNVLPVGCMPKLFAKFVADADAKALDVKCLDDVPYAQPFTGFHGWEP